MDQQERLARRDTARRRTKRRRRVLIAVLAALALVVATVAAMGATRMVGSSQSESRAAQDKQPPPPQLPRGGREILPRYRVVGFYGAPQAAACSASAPPHGRRAGCDARRAPTAAAGGL